MVPTPGSAAALDRKLLRDYSAPLQFSLDHERPDKTLDLGKDGTWVSADTLGRVLQLSGSHPKHGVVVAVPYEQFDGTRFREPLYVRAYRSRMLDFIKKGIPGYGVILKEGIPRDVSIITPRPNVVNVQFRAPESGVLVLVNLLVHEGELVQSTVLTNTAGKSRRVEYEFALNVSVNRASYGQLTEGGPIPIPESENQLEVSDDGGHFLVTNKPLDAHLEGCFYINEKIQSLCHLERQYTVNTPLTVSSPGVVHVPAKGSTTLTARFRLLAGTAANPKPFPNVKHIVATASKMMSTAAEWKDPSSLETYTIRRTLDYIIGNCLVPVGDGCCAIVTDHVALPLEWNRDN